jgi:signal transduction histidine kinase
MEQEDGLDTTRRRMERLIEDVASLETGENERVFSRRSENAVDDPRLVEVLELKRDLEFRLFKAEEERDRERERAENLSSELDSLQSDWESYRERSREEAKSGAEELAAERERRQYLEKRLLAVERDADGARNLFESESQRLRDANEALDSEVKSLRIGRREEQEAAQEKIRELESRYWKSQAEWEGERSRLETLLQQSQDREGELERSVETLSEFETRCRQLEDQMRSGSGEPGQAPAGEGPPRAETMLPPVDPQLDPVWERVAAYLEAPVAASYAHLKRLATARLGKGHQTVLKMAAGEIVRAQDALKALRHLFEAERAEIQSGRPETVVDALLGAWEPTLRRRRISLLRRLRPNLPRVRFSPETLRTSVYHVLLNAYESMSRGGNLAVTSELDPETGGLSIRFQDTGPGFGEETLEDPFTPFRSTRKDRLGIGLAIARTAMRAAGGDVTAENAKTGGAVVTLRFVPDEPEQEPPPSLTQAPAPQELPEEPQE